MNGYRVFFTNSQGEEDWQDFDTRKEAEEFCEDFSDIYKDFSIWLKL